MPTLGEKDPKILQSLRDTGIDPEDIEELLDQADKWLRRWVRSRQANLRRWRSLVPPVSSGERMGTVMGRCVKGTIHPRCTQPLP